MNNQHYNGHQKYKKGKRALCFLLCLLFLLSMDSGVASAFVEPVQAFAAAADEAVSGLVDSAKETADDVFERIKTLFDEAAIRRAAEKAEKKAEAAEKAMEEGRQKRQDAIKERQKAIDAQIERTRELVMKSRKEPESKRGVSTETDAKSVRTPDAKKGVTRSLTLPDDHTLTTVYWNPYDEDILNWEGTDIEIHKGNDDNSGATEEEPVSSLAVALQRLAPNGTIICLMSCILFNDSIPAGSGDVDGSGSVATLVMNDPDSDNLFWLQGRSEVTLSDFIVEENYSFSLGGRFTIGEDTTLKGMLVFYPTVEGEYAFGGAPVSYTVAPEDVPVETKLNFFFPIDETGALLAPVMKYYDEEYEEWSYDIDWDNSSVTDHVDLVSFPEGTDASAALSRFALNPDLAGFYCEVDGVLMSWQIRVKEGAPNVIEAALAEVDTSVVYLDPIYGELLCGENAIDDDESFGYSPSAPVGTFAKACERVDVGGTILLLNPICMDNYKDLDAFSAFFGNYYISTLTEDEMVNGITTVRTIDYYEGAATGGEDPLFILDDNLNSGGAYADLYGIRMAPASDNTLIALIADRSRMDLNYMLSGGPEMEAKGSVRWQFSEDNFDGEETDPDTGETHRIITEPAIFVYSDEESTDYVVDHLQLNILIDVDSDTGLAYSPEVDQTTGDIEWLPTMDSFPLVYYDCPQSTGVIDASDLLPLISVDPGVYIPGKHWSTRLKEDDPFIIEAYLTESAATVYWNPIDYDIPGSGGTIYIHKGRDTNSGITIDKPVYTLKKALQIVSAGGTVVALNNLTIPLDPNTPDVRAWNGTHMGLRTKLDYQLECMNFITLNPLSFVTLDGLEVDLTDAVNPLYSVMRFNGGFVRIGGNTVLRGNSYIESVSEEYPPLEFSAEPAAMADKISLCFDFPLNSANHFAGSGVTVFDLAVFPDGTDASDLIGTSFTLSENVSPSVEGELKWMLRTKLGHPNIIQAFLMEEYDGAIYLSGYGDDANNGLFDFCPVATYARALEILMGTAEDSAEIDAYRLTYGSYVPGEGVIRIIGAPVQVLNEQVWEMPANTWWYENDDKENGARIEPSYVERGKNYTDELIEVTDGFIMLGLIPRHSVGNLTLTNITIDGKKGEVMRSKGSIVKVDGSIATIGLPYLTLETGARLINNRADNGGAVFVGYGGAEMNDGAEISNCSTNSGGCGGAIFVNYSLPLETDEGTIEFNGSFTLKGGVIQNNSAFLGDGGALSIPGGEKNVTFLCDPAHPAQIINNSATYGGGISSRLDLTLSGDSMPVISGNTAEYGGGVSIDGDAENPPTLTLTNGVTIENNSAQYGGGVAARNANVTVEGESKIIRNKNSNKNVAFGTACGAGLCKGGIGDVIIRNGCEISGNHIDGVKGFIAYGVGVFFSGSGNMQMNGFVHDNYVSAPGAQAYGIGVYTFGENAITTIRGDVTDNYFNEVYNGSLLLSEIGDTKIYGVGVCCCNGIMNLSNQGGQELRITGNQIRSTVYSVYSYFYGIGVCQVGGVLNLLRVDVKDNEVTGDLARWRSYGGAIYVENAEFDPDAPNGLIVTGNTGGIYINNPIYEGDCFSLFQNSFSISDNIGAEGLTITDTESVSITGQTISNNTGGLTMKDCGTVTLTDCVFDNNDRTNTSGAGAGAQIEAESLTATNCTFSNNRGDSHGGGLCSLGGDATLTGCTFTNNVVSHETMGVCGGGIAFLGSNDSTYTVSNCVFGGSAAQSNIAYYGGAIFVREGDLTVKDNTQISYCHSCVGEGYGRGGGICAEKGKVILQSCDISHTTRGDTTTIIDPLTGEPSVLPAFLYPTYGGAVYCYHSTLYYYADACDLHGETVYLSSATYPMTLSAGFPADATVVKLELNVNGEGAMGNSSDYFRAGDTVVNPSDVYYGAHIPHAKASEYEEYFVLLSPAADVYNLSAEPAEYSLILTEQAVYINGVTGDDDRDGSTPAKAVKTFARAKELLTTKLTIDPDFKRRIYFCNTVYVEDEQTWTFEDVGLDNIALVAYPSAEATDWTMIFVRNPAAKLTIEGLRIYGNGTVDNLSASDSNSYPRLGIYAVDYAEVTLNDVTVSDQKHAIVIYSNSKLNGDNVVVRDCRGSGGHVTGGQDDDNPSSAGICVYQHSEINIKGLQLLNITTTGPYGGGMWIDRSVADFQNLYAYNCHVTFCLNETDRDSHGAFVCESVDASTNTKAQGAALYAFNSVVTISSADGGSSMFDSNGTEYGDDECLCLAGTAIGALDSSITLTDVKFYKNGDFFRQPWAYSLGTVFVRGSSVLTMRRCTFKQNKSMICTGVRLFAYYKNGEECDLHAPTAYIYGCTFGGEDEADANVVDGPKAASAILCSGRARTEKIWLVLREDDSTGVTIRNTIQNNVSTCKEDRFDTTKSSWSSGGTIYCSQTKVTIAKTDFIGNKLSHGGYGSVMYIEVLTDEVARVSDCTFVDNVNNADGYTGFGNVYIRGNATFEDCHFLRNRIDSFNGEDAYGAGICTDGYSSLTIADTVIQQNVINAVDTDGRNYLRGAGIYTNKVNISGSYIGWNRIDAVRSDTATKKEERLEGAGVWCSDVVAISDTEIIYNTLSMLGTDHLEGAGIYIAQGITVALRRLVLDNNEILTDSTRTGGVAIDYNGYSITSATSMIMEDISALGSVDTLGQTSLPLQSRYYETNAIELQVERYDSSASINMGGTIKVDGAIVMRGNNAVPIALTSELSAESTDLTISFNEAFIGKRLIKGSYYIDASQYLEASSPIRIRAGVIPTLADMELVDGEAYGDSNSIYVATPYRVYLSGSGNDENDGRTPRTPVRTFKTALMRINSIYTDYTIAHPQDPPLNEQIDIIICGKVEITGTELWDTSEEGVNRILERTYRWTCQPEVKRMMSDYIDATDSHYRGSMIEVKNGGKLTLSNITIDGQFHDFYSLPVSSPVSTSLVCGSILQVDEYGTAMVKEGTTIRNNGALCGGGIYVAEHGDCIMYDDATVEYCWAISPDKSGSALDPLYSSTYYTLTASIDDDPQFWSLYRADTFPQRPGPKTYRVQWYDPSLFMTAYGGGVYNAGTFKMKEGSAIRLCGFRSRYEHHCFGALLCSTGTCTEMEGVLNLALVSESGEDRILGGGAVAVLDGTFTLPADNTITKNFRQTLFQHFSDPAMIFSYNNGIKMDVSALLVAGGTVNIYGDFTQNHGARSVVSTYVFYWRSLWEPSNVKLNFQPGCEIYDNQASTVVNLQTGEVYTKTDPTGRIPVLNVTQKSSFSSLFLADEGSVLHMNGAELWIPSTNTGENECALSLAGTAEVNGCYLHDDREEKRSSVGMKVTSDLTNYYVSTFKAGVITDFWMGIRLSGKLYLVGGTISNIETYGVYVSGGRLVSDLTGLGAEIFNAEYGIYIYGSKGRADIQRIKIHDIRKNGIHCSMPSNGTVTPSLYLGYAEDGTVNRYSNNSIYNCGLCMTDESGDTVDGGAIFSDRAKVYIAQADIHDCHAVNGGAICCQATELHILGASIGNNTATGDGGGICLTPYVKVVEMGDGNDAIFIHHNTAGNGGGGISLQSPGKNVANYTFTRVSLSNNTAKFGGGMAIYPKDTGITTKTIVFSQCGFSQNTAEQTGGGLHIQNAGAGNGLSKLTAFFIRVSFTGNTAQNSDGGCLYYWRGTTYKNQRNEAVMRFGECSFNSSFSGGNGGGICTVTTVEEDLNTSCSLRMELYSCSGGDTHADGEGGFARFDKGTYQLDNFTAAHYIPGKGDPPTEHMGYSSDGDGGMLYLAAGANTSVTGGYYNGLSGTGVGNAIYVGEAFLTLINNTAVFAPADDFGPERDIYLADRDFPIQAPRTFSYPHRVYYIYPSEDYQPGDIVVHPPENGLLQDASVLLPNFVSLRYGTVIDRRAPDLILAQIVFLDGVGGHDPTFLPDGTYEYYVDPVTGAVYNGLTPDTAFYTFAASKVMLGDSAGCIYVCGTVTVSDTQEWTLLSKQALRRYTGFTISSEHEYDAFLDDMAVVADGGDLTISSINVEGRWNGTEAFTAEGSAFRVENGGTLTIAAGSEIRYHNTSGNGAVVNVEEGGSLFLRGGWIEKNSSSGKGDGVYQNGYTALSGVTLRMKDDIYLEANKTVAVVPSADSFATAMGFRPAYSGKISLNFSDFYVGRDVVVYPPGDVPGLIQKGLFKIPAAAMTYYRLGNEPERPNVLELRRADAVYVDGVSGLDTNSGSTPDDAFKTFRQAYYSLSHNANPSGGVIYIVNTVTLQSGVTQLSEAYQDSSMVGTYDTNGFIAIVRYVRPSAYGTLSGFTHTTNKNALIRVTENASLMMSGVLVDGHSQDVSGVSYEQDANGVTAAAPIFISETGNSQSGQSLVRLEDCTVQFALSSAQNGGAAAINGGALDIRGATEINDCADSAGRSVYQNGTLLVSGSPVVNGDIFLAEERFVSVPEAFTPTQPLSLTLDDPADGRAIADYDQTYSGYTVPGETEKGYFALPLEVIEAFNLNNRSSDPSVLELQVRGVVYIDGVNGNDSKNGLTPANAVLTLERAYSILKNYGGNTVYVVNTVTIDSNIELIGPGYISGATVIPAGADVSFIRYARPTSTSVSGFTKITNVNPLFRVSDGTQLILGDVTVDGHALAVETGDSRYVSAGVAATGAMFVVEEGGTLVLNNGAVLRNNNNAVAAENTANAGGAVHNDGKVQAYGVTVTGNTAALGNGIYQNGELLVYGASDPAFSADQWIYLTGEQGSENENVVAVGSAFNDGVKLPIDFASPETFRNAAVFDEYTFDTSVDNEKDHFTLEPSLDAFGYVLRMADPVTEPDTLELAVECRVEYHSNTTADEISLDPPATEPAYLSGDIVTVKTYVGTDGAFGTLPVGRTFKGWNTMPDESGDWYYPPGAAPAGATAVTDADGKFLIEHKVILYAIWEITDTHGVGLTIYKFADMGDLMDTNRTFLFEIEDIDPDSPSFGNVYHVYVGTYYDAAEDDTVSAWAPFAVSPPGWTAAPGVAPDAVTPDSYAWTTIYGLPESTYRVSEQTDWSWRYSLERSYGSEDSEAQADGSVTVHLTGSRTVSFVNTFSNPDYINGYAKSYSNTFVRP